MPGCQLGSHAPIGLATDVLLCLVSPNSLRATVLLAPLDCITECYGPFKQKDGVTRWCHRRRSAEYPRGSLLGLCVRSGPLSGELLYAPRRDASSLTFSIQSPAALGPPSQAGSSTLRVHQSKSSHCVTSPRADRLWPRGRQGPPADGLWLAGGGLRGVGMWPGPPLAPLPHCGAQSHLPPRGQPAEAAAALRAEVSNRSP